MGILAERLREESKKDNNFIVGSEIREALQEVEQENAELRAQLAKCVYALDMMLAVNVVEADKTYGTAYKHCEDAVRAAKEAGSNA